MKLLPDVHSPFPSEFKERPFGSVLGYSAGAEHDKVLVQLKAHGSSCPGSLPRVGLRLATSFTCTPGNPGKGCGRLQDWKLRHYKHKRSLKKKKKKYGDTVDDRIKKLRVQKPRDQPAIPMSQDVNENKRESGRQDRNASAPESKFNSPIPKTPIFVNPCASTHECIAPKWNSSSSFPQRHFALSASHTSTALPM